jgi:hypothetical protein
MSNQSQSHEELKFVGEDQDEAGTASEKSDEADTQADLTPEEKAVAEQRKRVYEGEVKSHVAKVVNGEVDLDQIPEYLKKEVQNRLARFTTKKDDTEDVVDKVTERIKFQSLTESLSPEEQVDAKKDYEIFKQNGLSVQEAQAKIRKLYSIPTPEELKRQRTIRSQQMFSGGGAVSPSESRNEVEPSTPKEQKFVAAMRRK